MRYVRHFVEGMRYAWRLAAYGERGDRGLTILLAIGYMVLYPVLLVIMPSFRRSIRKGM